MEVKLLWKYVKYEVDQWTWRMAGVRLDSEEKIADAQTDNEGSTINFVRRKTDEAVANIEAILRKRIVSVKEMSGDNTLDEDSTEWIITLTDNARIVGNVKTLTDLINEYVVCSVMREWSAMYYPQELARFQARMTELTPLLTREAFRKSEPVLSA